MLTVDPTYRLADGLPTERTMHACATAMKEWPSAVAGLWVMVSRNDAVVIGDCLIFGGVEVDGQFAIAYEVAESRWNQGFGKEAVVRVVEWLVDQPPASSLQAVVEPSNVASKKILIAAGLADTGARKGKQELWLRQL
jgi:RimJ/RimL family protein N-acetyltransferase